MIRLISGGVQWSGVMIDGSGQIITTSSDLGQAPVVDFVTTRGATGQAWVIGRDDNLDVALLEVISPGQVYDSVEVSTAGAPQINEAGVFLQYIGTSANVDRRSTRAIGVQQDLNSGIQYVQLQGLTATGVHGGALIDNQGRLRGLRMREGHMIDIGIGRAGQVYALGADALANLVLPQLRAGATVINTPGPGTSAGAPPSIPAIFKGGVTAGGISATSGSRIYAKVIKPGASDLWFSTVVSDLGKYLLPMGVNRAGYTNAVVQFWMNAGAAPQTSTYVPARTNDIDLVFP